MTEKELAELEKNFKKAMKKPKWWRLTKEQRLKRKEMRNIRKLYSRALNEWNKDVRKKPWDYCFGLHYIVEWLKYLRAYYNNGLEVVQTDDTRLRIVESLSEVLDAYYAWEGFESEYYHLDEPDAFEYETHEDGSVRITPKREELYTEESQAYFDQEYASRKQRFFLLLAEHIEDWWD